MPLTTKLKLWSIDDIVKVTSIAENLYRLIDEMRNQVNIQKQSVELGRQTYQAISQKLTHTYFADNQCLQKSRYNKNTNVLLFTVKSNNFMHVFATKPKA